MGIVTRDATAPYPADHTGNVEICRVGDWRDRELIPFNGERWTADARLIAAAPDQHAGALEIDRLSLVILSAVNFADKPHLEAVSNALRANRAAISKALGQQEASP